MAAHFSGPANGAQKKFGAPPQRLIREFHHFKRKRFALDSIDMNEQKGKKQNQKSDRGRTNPPGGNPRQNDAVDHDLYNDEGRPNLALNKQRKQQNYCETVIKKV